jgi:hypothetical protein
MFRVERLDDWFTRNADPATPGKIFESYMSAVNTVVCARGVIERCGPQRAVCALCFGQVGVVALVHPAL